MSLAAQGIDREAEPHFGPKVATAVAQDVRDLRKPVPAQEQDIEVEEHVKAQEKEDPRVSLMVKDMTQKGWPADQIAKAKLGLIEKIRQREKEDAALFNQFLEKGWPAEKIPAVIAEMRKLEEQKRVANLLPSLPDPSEPNR